LKGSITNAGPCTLSFSSLLDLAKDFLAVDATIAFGSGLTVSWSGKPIGNIKLADVKLTGDVGAAMDIESTFEVADVAHLTEFTKVASIYGFSFFSILTGSTFFAGIAYTRIIRLGHCRRKSHRYYPLIFLPDYSLIILHPQSAPLVSLLAVIKLS
jgi:hypothetical protein